MAKITKQYLDFNGLNLYNEYIFSKIKQSDWSVNDENDPRYVENRTHYISDPVETVLLEETSIETTGEDGASAFVSDSIKLVEGYTYLVTFNGTEYECVAYCYDDWGIVIIGNGSLIDAEGGNGEPFAYMFMEGDGSDLITQEAGTYTLKIVGMIPEVVQLPAQFLMNSNVRNGEGEGSIIEGLDTAAIGRGSHAEGVESYASGDYSHAEGCGGAFGKCAHAEGDYSTASGYASHAEGYETTASGYASHAEGEFSTASGNYSHAEGESARAFGRGSHAEGQSTYAIGYRAHSEGRYTVALGDYSHTEGCGNYASIRLTGDAGSTSYTVSDSYSTIAIGDFIAAGDAWSIVAGYDSSTKTITLESTLNADKAFNLQYASLYSSGIASGYHSHSEGYQTVASGNNSHSEGYKTVASGTYGAHAEGDEATASGMQSHAEGAYTIAQGNTSHAEGWQTKAYGDACHVEGSKTVAHGSYSHAEGEGTIASANAHAQHVQGRYNLQDTKKKYAHIVGNGTEDARSNAHTIDWEGNAWYQGTIKVGGTGQDDETAVEVATKNDIVQANWNQSDKTAIDYVKNRTHYDTVLEEYVVFDDYLDFASSQTVPIEYEVPVGTIVEQYCNGNLLCSIALFVSSDRLLAGDGRIESWFDNTSKTVNVGNYFSSGTIKITVKNLTVFKQLDEKFIPTSFINTALAQAKESGEFDGKDGSDYILTDADKQEIAEQAAQLVDCNINPTTKTDPMTQPVGVDSDGKLWTEPSVGEGGLTAEQITALNGMFKIAAYTEDATEAYTAFKTAFGITDEPEEPDIPDEPEVTLTSISATYSGGDVTVGTALTDLTGIVVTATYSDGSTATVTGYTLSGTIAEGENTITTTYEGMTATFTVVGIAESGGEETPEILYELAEPTILDGATSIDTGWNPLKEDHDFTVISKASLPDFSEQGDILDRSIASAYQYISGIYSLNILVSNANKIKVEGVETGVYANFSAIAITHTKGSSVCSVKILSKKESTAEYGEITGEFTYKLMPSFSNTMTIGYNQRQKNYLKGTIEKFVIYSRVLTDEEINAQLA